MVKSSDIREMAEILDRARQESREVGRLSERFTELDLAAAYQVQDEGIRLREARGEKYFGMKMGFTSQAKREQMGLHSPIYGILTDRMEARERFELKGSIHPKIEPEIVFYVAHELKGRVNADEALDACSGVGAAMEILDSRFVGFKYFSLPDVIADNCSSSHFVLGSKVVAPRSLDLANLAMTMEVNGKTVQSALSRAISGNPVNSLVQLCEILDSRGLSLPAGSVVLAGAATQAVSLETGSTVRLTVDSLGETLIKT